MAESSTPQVTPSVSRIKAFASSFISIELMSLGLNDRSTSLIFVASHKETSNAFFGYSFSMAGNPGWNKTKIVLCSLDL